MNSVTSMHLLRHILGHTPWFSTLLRVLQDQALVTHLERWGALGQRSLIADVPPQDDAMML